MRVKPSILLVVSLLAVSAVAAADADRKGPAGDPAKLQISVTPDSVAPGGQTQVTLRLVPNPGIKITKYPKIKLQVPAKAGLVLSSEVAVGEDSPPPPDKLETNYYKVVDPVKLKLTLDSGATRGSHEIEGRLNYFYCVAASGFCAPARVPIKIPLTVR